KWDIHCAQIGHVTASENIVYYKDNQIVANLPAESLVLGGGAPVYERAYQLPAYFDNINAYNIDNIAVPANLQEIAYRLIQLPNIASKKSVYVQYDSMVGNANLSTNAPSDAAAVWIHDTQKALAITTDCNSRYVYADPYIGAMIAVCEAARNIVCTGGMPLGVTNCLNFGNPHNPEVYYQFVHAIKGMGDACRRLNTPVTGGNVSFYNQSETGPVFPTPTIGMVGLIEDKANVMTLFFKQPGHLIYLLGKSINDIGCSEYLHNILDVEHSTVPYFNLNEEVELHAKVTALIEKRLIQSAHDISEGGLFACLIECCLHGDMGFNLMPNPNIRPDAYLFGEAQGRVVVSIQPELKVLFEAEMGNYSHWQRIGAVNPNGSIHYAGEDWGYITDWKKAYESAL
ncbi:MAG: phosphoribosylformylglycinamidine synthase subunit PurL, partial [Chitinophagia bacterium]|nr:phosphoribosylformylglycinamidine synthase subunit PurL [Chitinophagia bacterium]